MAVANGAGKVPNNPDAGLTDAQRAAEVAATHAANDQFLRNFVAQHGNPHSLPVIRVGTWAAPPPTLAAAASRAQTIVHGTVQDVTFVPNPSGGLPIATAHVQVLETIKGQASQVISVGQLGGPVAQKTGGALAELDSDELVLPGDEVVLLLQPTGSSGVSRTVLGGGVYFVRNGVVTGESSEQYKLNGGSVQKLLDALRAAG
jgi:hypothetical protein